MVRESGEVQALDIATVSNHLLYPPDYFVAKMDLQDTLAMTDGLTVMDDESRDDPFTIKSILRGMENHHDPILEGLNTQELYRHHMFLQEPEYRDKVTNNEFGFKSEMPQDAIVVVPVLAYSEIDHIEHYLREYSQQKTDHSKTTLFLFLNDNGDASHQDGRQNSIAYIEKYRGMNPDFNIQYRYVAVPEFAGQLGKTRRLGVDIAYSSHLQQFPDAPDPIIINNDVDVTSLSPDYIQNHIDYHRSNPDVDLTTQTLDFDEFGSMSIPLLTTISRVHSFMHKILLKNAGVSTAAGTDFAVKPKTWYQIIDTLNIHNRGEDVVIGAAIAALRGNHDSVVKIPTQEPHVVSSARRIVDSFRAGTLERMQSTDYKPYQKNINFPDRRVTRNADFQDEIMTDKFTDSELNDELMKTFMKFHHKYPRLPPDFYTKALEYVGIVGKFDGHTLEISDTDKLRKGIEEAKKQIA